MLHKTSKQEKSNYTKATRKGVTLHWKFIGNSITVHVFLHINCDLPLCANKTSKLVWVLCNFLNGFMSLTWIMELLSYFFLACKDSPINCKKKKQEFESWKRAINVLHALVNKNKKYCILSKQTLIPKRYLQM